METKNYIPIKSHSLFYKQYIIVDLKEGIGKTFFQKKKLSVHFQEKYVKDDEDYSFVFCKVKKKDESQFLTDLEELKNKILLLGYNDYSLFCQKMIQQIYPAYQ